MFNWIRNLIKKNVCTCTGTLTTFSSLEAWHDYISGEITLEEFSKVRGYKVERLHKPTCKKYNT